jgi:hypothetical protein
METKIFLLFLLVDVDVEYKITTYPDPGGLKTYGTALPDPDPQHWQK